MNFTLHIHARQPSGFIIYLYIYMYVSVCVCVWACACLCIGHMCMPACAPACLYVCLQAHISGMCSFLSVSVMYIFLESLALFFYILRQGHMNAPVCLCMDVCATVGMLRWVGVLWLLIYISGYFDQVSRVWITLIPCRLKHLLHIHTHLIGCVLLCTALALCPQSP